MVKGLSTMREIQVQSLGQEDTLEKEMATHSSTCLENPVDTREMMLDKKQFELFSYLSSKWVVKW